ncbi:uncharacterized protein N7443_003258 [Penicillium atrosanguineum]|uniref:Uncharacterized protein n=1 Tax=Penicillium atrosanguineum TaxID=1132637 RepID=A0A9W9PXG3_9EURO|nr:uncharacterized protein N7443_003258 [Penicillium atrosanguineum]KAJ5310797.1 hypothetical protein N7443_003258 [Penicillium atrosanguineum]KAJ5316321.1 hypothetical protein N7476_006628 [Penicillium atrosanguineum]
MARNKNPTTQRNYVVRLIKIGLKWLSHTSNVSQAEIQEMKQTLEQIEAEATGDRNLLAVAMGDLTLEDVENIFGLKKLTPKNEQKGDKWNLVPFNPKDVPDSEDFEAFYDLLCQALQNLDFANHDSTRSEALVHTRLDMLLGLVLGWAKEDRRIIFGNSVSWGYETPFHVVIKMNAKKKMLCGRPDYALWYGAQANVETNLVIVEAKTSDEIGKGERQVLAYMGLVHAGRKERGREDTTVYGIATDCIKLFFYQVNDSSKWCSTILIWGQTEKEDETIVAMLLRIMKLAPNQSPTHTRENTSQSHQFSSSAGEDIPMQGC